VNNKKKINLNKIVLIGVFLIIIIFMISILVLQTISNNLSYNTFVMIGDSLTEQSALANSSRTTSKLQVYMKSNGFGNVTVHNKGIGSSCLSDYGKCDTVYTPMVERFPRDVLYYTGKWVYIQPNINDVSKITIDRYLSDFSIILDMLKTDVNKYEFYSGTIASSTSENGIPGFNEDRLAYWNSKLREFFIINEVPYMEHHFFSNHSSMYIYDYVHVSTLGADMWAKHIMDMILNKEEYIDTVDNFRIYHDCNNTISILNYTLRSPKMTCNSNSNNDWLILKEITKKGFFIERADKEFYLSIKDRFKPNCKYDVVYSKTIDSYESDSNGNIENMKFPATKNAQVTFKKKCGLLAFL
jgi:hypothetical protein